MPNAPSLLVVLESLRERGALGEPSLPHAIDHAEAFLAALPVGTTDVLDLGSGGGLPGLVLAARRPDLRIVLTDRRQRRADLLRLAITQLGCADRVTVLTGDVVALARRVDLAGCFDAVTARSFGEPLWTARCAAPFLRPTGVLIVSEPPAGQPGAMSRWDDDALAAVGLCRSEQQFPHVQRLERC